MWTKLADSPKEFLANIKAMVDAIGVDHVGIGTNTDLLSPRCWPRDQQRFCRVFGAVTASHGMSGDREKPGGWQTRSAKMP